MSSERIIQTIEFPTVGVTFRKGESGCWQCPICGEFTLGNALDYSYCPVCDAPNNEIFLAGLKSDTSVTPDEARRQWKENGKVEWNWR